MRIDLRRLRRERRGSGGGRVQDRAGGSGAQETWLLGLQQTAGNAAVRSLVTQRQAESEQAEDAGDLVREAVLTGGRPLDEGVRAEMETALGHNFSGVEVHTSGEAVESARALGAKAYTAGSHVLFGAGQYRPETQDGKRLIAHELTHVVQQAAGPVDGGEAGGGLKVSTPGDPFEQQADRVAEEFGRNVQTLRDDEGLRAAPMVQRQMDQEPAAAAGAQTLTLDAPPPLEMATQELIAQEAPPAEQVEVQADGDGGPVSGSVYYDPTQFYVQAQFNVSRTLLQTPGFKVDFGDPSVQLTLNLDPSIGRPPLLTSAALAASVNALNLTWLNHGNTIASFAVTAGAGIDTTGTATLSAGAQATVPVNDRVNVVLNLPVNYTPLSGGGNRFAFGTATLGLQASF